MKIEIIDSDKAKITGNIIEYINKLKYNSNSNIKVDFIFDDVNKVKNFLLSPKCGCTITETKVKPDKIAVKIGYDTKRVGEFEKVIGVSYNENGRDVNTIVKIKGEVARQNEI